MTTISQIKQIAEDFLSSTSHKGTLQTSEIKDPLCFSASTSLKTGDINLGYNPDYEIGNSGQNVPEIVRALVRHEVLHHRNLIREIPYSGVPGDIQTATKSFYEPMYGILKSKGFNEQDISYAENALEDTLLHLEGINDFPSNWEGIRKFFKHNAQVNEQGLTPFYSAHVRLNLLLWGTPWQRQAMQKYYANSPEEQKAVSNLLSRLEICDNGIKSREQLRQELINPQRYSEIATIYAEEMSKLMTPGYAMPTPNHSGAGTRGREQQNPVDEGEGNIFQKSRQTGEYTEQRVREHYGEGKPLPSWMNDTPEKQAKSLKKLYQFLAKKFRIKTKKQTETDMLPIFYSAEEDFDPLIHDSRRLKAKPSSEGTRIVKREDPYEIPIEVQSSKSHFQKARAVLVDQSGSMEGGGDDSVIPWGDESAYHSVLLTWEGYVKSLREQRLITSRNSLETFGFSEDTKTAKGLDNSDVLLYNPSFGGDTLLDREQMQRAFAGKDNLILFMTDGGIRNWEGVKGEVLSGIKRNTCIWAQIGEPTSQSQEAESAGAYVLPILSFSDLPSGVIDATNRIKFKSSTKTK